MIDAVACLIPVQDIRTKYFRLQYVLCIYHFATNNFRDGKQERRRQQQLEISGGMTPRLVTRHIFLVRHGQYDESKTQDQHRTLTELGKIQSKKVGQRLAGIIHHSNTNQKECALTILAVSALTRAKQTADLISQELDKTYEEQKAKNPDKPWRRAAMEKPDPLLNEGFPVHHIPGPTVRPKQLLLIQ